MNGIELSKWLRQLAQQCERYQLLHKQMRPGEWRILASVLHRAADEAQVLERRLALRAEQELRRFFRGGGAA